MPPIAIGIGTPIPGEGGNPDGRRNGKRSSLAGPTGTQSLGRLIPDRAGVGLGTADLSANRVRSSSAEARSGTQSRGSAEAPWRVAAACDARTPAPAPPPT